MINKILSRFNAKSSRYWEKRYQSGGNSGCGSYGKLAEFKKKVLDRFCNDHAIQSIIEFGSGDGNQISLLNYKGSYIGLDISAKAVELCKEIFKNDHSKKFIVFSGKKDFCKQHKLKAEVTLSLDVLYHLLEDTTYKQYMYELFYAAEKYVIIYSSNYENQKDNSWHVRHRNFTVLVEKVFPQFKLIDHIPNEFPVESNLAEKSSADFFIYERK